MSETKRISKSTTINAPIEKVFDELLQVQRWHMWTKSITSISILDNSPICVGARLKIHQPKLMPAVWTITELERNNTLVWEKKSPGLKIVAGHVLTSSPEGTVVQLSIQYQGLLTPWVFRLTRDLTSRYLTMETEGLKNHCERVNK